MRSECQTKLSDWTTLLYYNRNTQLASFFFVTKCWSLNKQVYEKEGCFLSLLDGKGWAHPKGFLSDFSNQCLQWETPFLNIVHFKSLPSLWVGRNTLKTGKDFSFPRVITSFVSKKWELSSQGPRSPWSSLVFILPTALPTSPCYLHLPHAHRFCSPASVDQHSSMLLASFSEFVVRGGWTG